MRRVVFIALATAIAMPNPAPATGVYPQSTRNCFEKIEVETAKLVGAVHDQMRISIRRNMQGLSSKCAGPLVCAGGPKNNKPCTTTAFCGQAGGVAFQCLPRATPGIAGIINQATTNLRQHIAAACTQADLDTLFGVAGGSARCPDRSSPSNGLDIRELADCILRAAAGEVAVQRSIGATGEMLALAAPDFAVDATAPTEICGVILGGETDIGTKSTLGSIISPLGALAPLVADGCTAGNPICQTKGQAPVGTLTEPPLQTMAGSIPVCIVNLAEDAGNGTSEDGWINLATGEQHSIEPSATAVYLAVWCPICDKTTKVCTSQNPNNSPHEGHACNRPGETDVACPPSQATPPPLIGKLLDLSTEPQFLLAPSHNPGGGVTNPVGAFCGYCDGDDALGCSSDQACQAKGACLAGVGNACCIFGSETGAFGDPTVSLLQVQGARGPFAPRLAALSCVGRSGNPVVDGSVGLPGPVRSVQTRLNAFQYP